MKELFNRIKSVCDCHENGFLSYIKRALNNKHIESIAARIIAFLMRFVFYTTRWTVIGEERPHLYHKNHIPFITCLWHDRLMLAPCLWKWKKKLHVLASNHKDGRFIAKVVKRFSMPAVYGSTGKGVNAAKKLIQLIKKGEYIAIIPDGPRGPRHKLANGAVVISILTKTDIIPFGFCVKRYVRLNSWDKFILAWPFNCGVMVWGNPISHETLKAMGSMEERLSYVENKINETSLLAYEVLNNDKCAI